ncbi:MAG: HNH endonuclease [Acidobacteriota bacterium]|nr:HNH endonuclease [Acidobacteriota bacterium]
MPRKLPADIREQVRRRADYLCEYCHINERWQYVHFTIDHLTPSAGGGEETPENLALACFHCNRRKSDKQSGVDRLTGLTVPLFNPRSQQWREHFVWSSDGLRIVPLTAIGRATVELLELNRERVLRIRAADVEVRRHPPKGDLVQRTDQS